MLTFKKDTPYNPPVTQIIQTHLDLMLSLSPPESSHALDLEGLATEDIRFWSVWQEGTLVGMCAYKILDPAYFVNDSFARPIGDGSEAAHREINPADSGKPDDASSFAGPFGGDSEAVRREIKYAEIKSMHTIEKVRGQGIGNQMLDFLLDNAISENISVFYLETGVQPGFKAARRLYETKGFSYCEPFADYDEDPNSVFMTLVK